LKLLPPDKRGEERVGEKRGEKGKGGKGTGMKGKRTFERSHSFKFATTPLQRRRGEKGRGGKRNKGEWRGKGLPSVPTVPSLPLYTTGYRLLHGV